MKYRLTFIAGGAKMEVDDMSGPVTLTPEQIAADFCAANPGKSIFVGGVIRDAAGIVKRHKEATQKGVNYGTTKKSYSPY